MTWSARSRSCRDIVSPSVLAVFTFTADSALATSIECNWPGWWCQEKKARLLGELERENDPKKRKALIERTGG